MCDLKKSRDHNVLEWIIDSRHNFVAENQALLNSLLANKFWWGIPVSTEDGFSRPVLRTDMTDSQRVRHGTDPMFVSEQ